MLLAAKPLGLGVALAFLIAAQSPAPSADKAYQDGLAVWRSTGIANTTCAFCHSPDAIEIAAYDFGDADIRRRAIPHLGVEGADKIVAFIHAVREKYGIRKLLDPIRDRPLQPGGEVLPGTTPEQRDFAFAKELQTALPTLAAGKVDSLQDAERAKQELIELDPRKLKVGIPFNRISEDGFHGREHATFAHWIADTALQLKFPWPFYFAQQDKYLQNPTDENLLELVKFPNQFQTHVQYAQQMTNDKYRALLIYAHVLRLEYKGAHAFDRVGPVLFGELVKKAEPNPLFELGVFADARSDTPFSEFHFPDAVLEKKMGGPTQAEQMRQIRLPSLYAGWLMDQGLQRTDICPGPRATAILTQRLLSDGPYPMHDAFVIAKKLVTQGFVPEAWGDSSPQHFEIDFSSFLEDGNFRKFEPADPEGRALYGRFVSNVFKMALQLYKEQGKTYEGDPSGAQIPVIEAYLKNAGSGL